MKANNSSFVILSACNVGDNSLQQANKTLILSHKLTSQGYQYKTVLGMYKGHREMSLLVMLPDQQQKKHKGIVDLLNCAREKGQDSILIRHADMTTQAMSCKDATTIELGIWKEATRAAEYSTFDPTTRKHFSTKKVGE